MHCLFDLHVSFNFVLCLTVLGLFIFFYLSVYLVYDLILNKIMFKRTRSLSNASR